MRQTSTRTRTSPSSTVTLHELPALETAAPTGDRAEHDRVVFVTNAVRRRTGLRNRNDPHRPVLAAVVR